MAIQWLEATKRGGNGASRSKFISVSFTKTARKDDDAHILVISLSVDAMKDLRLQIGDRLRLGYEKADGGWLVIVRSQDIGPMITPGSGTNKGGTEKLRGKVASGVAKFSGAPFGLPAYSYTALSRQDVIIDDAMLRIPVSDLMIAEGRDLLGGTPRRARRVLTTAH
jgi:hypothetical protein